jgi:hypothetical protein
MKYIGKRVVDRNGNSALLVNDKIVLTNQKLNDWLYYVNEIKEVQPGVYIAEGLTPIKTGVMNTTSLTFGDYKIYKRPFFVDKGKFVTNVENINKPYKDKYFAGGTFPVAFIGVELEGYFPQFGKEYENIYEIQDLAEDVRDRHKAFSVSTSEDASIAPSDDYNSLEVKYLIDRSDLGILKRIYEDLGIVQNNSCGNHIHMSFNSPEYYWLVFSPIFYERFKQAYVDHFKDEKYISRLKNRYCEYMGMNTVFEETRYKMINETSFSIHGTAEFRILPYADNAEEYYESVKFVVETTEKILNDLVKEQYLERILSDYAIPLVVITRPESETIAFDLLEYFFPKKDFSKYYFDQNNFALLYYPERQRILLFDYPVFSNLLVTKLTSRRKPLHLYYPKTRGVLNDLNKNKNNQT